MWVSGTSGSVTVNTIVLSVTNWSVDWRTDNLDVSYMGQGTLWADFIDGVPDYDIRMDCIYKADENPFGAAQGPNQITIGSTANATLWITSGEGGLHRYVVPNLLITDVSSEGSVRDTIRYSITAKGSAYSAAATVKVPGVA